MGPRVQVPYGAPFVTVAQLGRAPPWWAEVVGSSPTKSLARDFSAYPLVQTKPKVGRYSINYWNEGAVSL